MRKKKHVPQRTCVGCRTVLPKRSMIRIVRTAEGVKIDPSGKLTGRGAYIHQKRDCWEKGIKGSLARALKTTISAEDHQLLKAFMEELPIETEPATK
ncbi:MAG: YlxR family protein [Anaerolineae bacterium]|nr:YlxR family protein [Anaerolineae bacterium]